jgi:hypothetical protein
VRIKSNNGQLTKGEDKKLKVSKGEFNQTLEGLSEDLLMQQ